MSAHRTGGAYTPRSRNGQIAEMVATFREWLQSLFAEFLRRGLGLAVLLLAVAMFAALASFNPADPSFDVATGREPTNWLGPSGAYGAGVLFELLGVAALALVVTLGAGAHVTRLALRVTTLALGTLLLGAGLGALPGFTELPAGGGGIAGRMLLFATGKVAASFGLGTWFFVAVPLIFTLLGLTLITVSSGIRARTLYRTGVGTIALAGAGIAGLSRLGLRRRKPADEEEDALEPTEDLRDPDDSEEEEDEDSEDAEMPVTRGSAAGKRVRRPEERGRRSRAKGDLQPALDLAEGEYQLPPLGLLTEPPHDSDAPAFSDDALEENARLLESVLGDFGVRGRIVAVRPGPVVTLYELEPAAGVKSSRVVSLSDDIARSMSAVAARVAVIPGRNVIGIELPNLKRETVYLRELFSAPEYEKARAPLTLALGKTIGGEAVMADLAKMPHLLIAGTTGSGKSVALNTMILSLLYRMSPEHCRIIMIDPKMLELSVYEGIPHLLSPVVIDPKKAVVALKWAVREMETRYGKMAKIGVRGVEAFNERVRKAKDKGEVLKRTVQTGFDRETGRPVYEDEVLELEPMPFIVVVVDEMADLMMISGKEIEGAVQRLAQMARAAGIHLIAATQRPSVDVITGTIKANFPTRISFQVTSKIDSRTILGEQGAEQLLGQGDMLYMMAGGRIRRVHGPFVTDEEVEDVVKFLKTQGRPDYLDAVTEEPDEESEDPYGTASSEGGDDLFDKAVAIVARERKVSTSYIQRRLQIGYNRAARLIERMEEDGMISKPNHQGKREILLPEDRE
jgi:DNA segregation ATPase FtsK/SpoIIIE, S-DNA-T family